MRVSRCNGFCMIFCIGACAATVVELMQNKLHNITIDAVFEKVGTGATLQAIKEILHDSNSNPKFFISKPDTRQIETAHMILSLDGVEQTHPEDRNEYKHNFEKVLEKIPLFSSYIGPKPPGGGVKPPAGGANLPPIGISGRPSEGTGKRPSLPFCPPRAWLRDSRSPKRLRR